MKKTFTFVVDIDENKIIKEVAEEQKRGSKESIATLVMKKIDTDKYNKMTIDMMEEIYNVEQKIFSKCLDRIFPSTAKNTADNKQIN